MTTLMSILTEYLASGIAFRLLAATWQAEAGYSWCDNWFFDSSAVADLRANGSCLLYPRKV